MALIVAIDAPGDDASVAVGRAGVELAARVVAGPGRPSAVLLDLLEQALAEAGVTSGQVDAVAVAIGPGAFTGIRLGLSVAQGLALAWDRPLLPVSSLAALAMDAPVGPRPVLAAVDARMGEVYGGWFRRDEAGGVLALGPEWLAAPDSVAGPGDGAGWLGIGSAFDLYGEVIAQRLGAPSGLLRPMRAGAQRVVDLGWRRWPGAAVAPERVEPTYLRNKVALTSAEQQAGRHRG